MPAHQHDLGQDGREEGFAWQSDAKEIATRT